MVCNVISYAEVLVLIMGVMFWDDISNLRFFEQYEFVYDIFIHDMHTLSSRDLVLIHWIHNTQKKTVKNETDLWQGQFRKNKIKKKPIFKRKTAPYHYHRSRHTTTWQTDRYHQIEHHVQNKEKHISSSQKQ